MQLFQKIKNLFFQQNHDDNLLFLVLKIALSYLQLLYSFIKQKVNEITFYFVLSDNFQVQTKRMLRQKRFSITKQTLKLPKTMNAWSNDENISIFQVTNSKWHSCQSTKQSQKRNQLTQISNQNSLLLFKPQLKSSQLIETSQEYKDSLVNSKQIVLARLTQMVQNRALILPQNPCSSEINPIWQGARSKTAQSNQSRGSKWGQAIVNRCNFILNVHRPDENQDRISMSRALINHATVKKNSAQKKFFMRKEKKIEASFFSARQMILQNNQRKRSKEKICRQIERSVSMKEGRGKKALKISQKRYGRIEQFDLKGWDNDSLQYD